MFGKKDKRKTVIDHLQNTPHNKDQRPVSIDALRETLSTMFDAEIIERVTNKEYKVSIIYIRTLIDQQRLNEAIIEPIIHCSHDTVYESIESAKINEVFTIEEAKQQLFTGSVILYDSRQLQWWAVPLINPLSRAIESSETESILYGPKDSFSEQIEQNITMIRRRLPIDALKSEKLTIGSNSKTTVILMYIEGIANPELISIARQKITEINFDLIIESSNLSAFMDDNIYSVFPEYQQTDRPDTCVYSLDVGKLVILIGNTPFALIAPITFFHLFQSPEDYIHRWVVASFLRCIRYFSFLLSVTLIPLYVAFTTHHYQMIPLQILFVLVESRSKLPFTPFWEAFIMLIVLEIIKEASLRMPTKTSQSLGVIGGIVIGQAAVDAGFASKVLIVLVSISTIASFLVPNYLVTKASTLIQFAFLILSSFLGVMGIMIGLIGIFAHLNGITSLKQPYFAPVSPFYWKDWIDLFIRGPLNWMKVRPEHLHTLNKRRFSRRR